MTDQDTRPEAEIRRLRDWIVTARWRLTKGRAMWNGPCHECDAALAHALQGDALTDYATDREQSYIRAAPAASDQSVGHVANAIAKATLKRHAAAPDASDHEIASRCYREAVEQLLPNGPSHQIVCTQKFAAALAEVRRAAVEQCAQQADDESECEDGEYYIARLIAKRIRALSPTAKEPTP